MTSRRRDALLLEQEDGVRVGLAEDGDEQVAAVDLVAARRTARAPRRAAGRAGSRGSAAAASSPVAAAVSTCSSR